MFQFNSLTWHIFKNFLFSKRTGALIRTIAWVCVSGIALGVFSLIVVISVMNGFNDSIRKRLLAIEPHLVVLFDPQTTSTKELWLKSSPQLLADHTDLKTSVYVQQDVILRTYDGYFGGAQARGVDPDALNYILGQMAKQRKTAFPEDPQERIELQPGEVLVGIDLARSLGIFEGDELTLAPPESLLLPAGEIPQVEKVTVPGFISSNVADIDSHTLYYISGESLKRFQNTASRQTGVEIRMRDPLSFAGLQKKLKSLGFKVESWKDRNSALFASLKLERIMIALVLSLSALIASFSIITVLILLTLQKRREIGLLMATGLSPNRTQRLFTKIGMMLSSFGLGTGILAGTLVSYYIEKNPLDILPSIYYDSRVPALVDFKFIVIVTIVSMLIALLASWLPAKRASKLLPVMALAARSS